jgi:hypothetical protein
MEHSGAYWVSIFRLLKEIPSFRFQQSLLIIGSTRAGFKEPLDDYFFELNVRDRDGFQSLLEDLVDFGISDEEYEEIKVLLDSGDYFGIWSFSRNKCKRITLLEPYEYLRQEICRFRKRSISPGLALAGLYFSFQLDLLYNNRLDKIKSSQRPE